MTDDLVHVRALTTATGLRTRTNMLNASMRKQNYETSLTAIEDNSGVTKQCAVSSNLHARSTGNYSPVTTSACTLAATLCTLRTSAAALPAIDAR